MKKSIKLPEGGQKRQAVVDLRQQYPIAVVREVLNYPRSQVYYQARSPDDETALKAGIMGLTSPAIP